MKNNKWTYELYNEEHWSCNEEFDTREEAIEAGKEAALDDGEITSFYIGRIVDFIPHVNPYRIIDDLVEDTGEECGEVSDSFLDTVTKEQILRLGEMLDKTLNEWLDETNNQPRFYMLRSVDTIEVE
jgi:hypothetical protein